MINNETSGDHGLRKGGAENNKKMSGECHNQNWKPSSGSKNRVGIMFMLSLLMLKVQASVYIDTAN